MEVGYGLKVRNTTWAFNTANIKSYLETWFWATSNHLTTSLPRIHLNNFCPSSQSSRSSLSKIYLHYKLQISCEMWGSMMMNMKITDFRITLKLEAVRFSEMLVPSYQSSWHHTPGDSSLRTYIFLVSSSCTMKTCHCIVSFCFRMEMLITSQTQVKEILIIQGQSTPAHLHFVKGLWGALDL
jgi:hypothetical protein